MTFAAEITAVNIAHGQGDSFSGNAGHFAETIWYAVINGADTPICQSNRARDLFAAVDRIGDQPRCQTHRPPAGPLFQTAALMPVSNVRHVSDVVASDNENRRLAQHLCKLHWQESVPRREPTENQIVVLDLLP